MESIFSPSMTESEHRWLRLDKEPESVASTGDAIRSVDLFSGCGGLTLGIHELCRRMKTKHVVEFANEWDPNALNIFSRNFKPAKANSLDINSMFSAGHRKTPTKAERAFLEDHMNAMEPDLLVGGPPCQGHSDLNNHTRRQDDRNNLYFRMSRAAALLNPKAIIIENVSTVVHSKEKVVQRTRKSLEKAGYSVDEGSLWAHHYGVPQKRRRHFLVASREGVPDFSILDSFREQSVGNPRDIDWAIKDLRDAYDETDAFNSSATPSKRNQERMDYLLEKEIFELPNEERPPCHQEGHNYPAVYGRMRWEEPASTITAGFGSTGQGRFMYPDRCSRINKGRTLTPHEAARIQTFPNWFDFGGHRRGTLSKTIGNAVPPLLAMHVAHVALSAGG